MTKSELIKYWTCIHGGCALNQGELCLFDVERCNEAAWKITAFIEAMPDEPEKDKGGTGCLSERDK